MQPCEFRAQAAPRLTALGQKADLGGAERIDVISTDPFRHFNLTWMFDPAPDC